MGDLFNDLQLLANEGDTVEPGNKIAIISRSADATHVAPSETTSEKGAPQPTQKVSEEKKAPKVETAPAKEKPKAPPAILKSPTELWDLRAFVNDRFDAMDSHITHLEDDMSFIQRCFDPPADS